MSREARSVKEPLPLVAVLTEEVQDPRLELDRTSQAAAQDQEQEPLPVSEAELPVNPVSDLPVPEALELPQEQAEHPASEVRPTGLELLPASGQRQESADRFPAARQARQRPATVVRLQEETLAAGLAILLPREQRLREMESNPSAQDPQDSVAPGMDRTAVPLEPVPTLDQVQPHPDKVAEAAVAAEAEEVAEGRVVRVDQ